MKKIFSVFLRLLISLALFLVVSYKSYGQDVIVKKSGEEINAKVEQINDSDIKYHKADNQTGPLYTILKSDIFMIRYANGTKDVFGNQQTPAENKPVVSSKVSFNASDLSYARKASTLGYVLAVPIIVLGVTAGAVQGNTDVSVPVGAAATLVAGIGIPLVSSGAGKTRRITGVEGSQGMRLAAWIGYGMTIVDALTLIGIGSSGGYVPSGLTYSVAILGAASSVLMASEAKQVYNQSSELMKGVSIRPVLGTTRNLYGRVCPTIGIRMNF